MERKWRHLSCLQETVENMNKRTKSNALWVTQTAIMIALIVVVQATTSGMGQFVTGSLVNLILILTAAFAGFTSGLTVACLSPIFAFIFGVGPQFPQIIACIMAGNLVLVLVWWFILGKTGHSQYPRVAAAAIAGAVLKFTVLWILVVQVVAPMSNNIPAPAKQNLAKMFSTPQLITALIGGAIACVIVPQLAKVLKRRPTNQKATN